MKLFSTKKRLVLLGVALTLQSFQAQALSLVDAYQAALAHDTIYRAAQYENEAGQQYKVIGKSRILPSVSASYSFNRVKSEVESSNNGRTFNEDRDYDSKNAVVQLRQPIINADSWARYKLGNLQTGLSDIELAINKQAFIQRFFTAFAEANYAEDLLALSTTERNAYKNQAQANEVMFERGEGTKTELYESRAKLSFSEAQVIEAQNKVADSHDALVNIIGNDFTTLDKLNNHFTQLELTPQDFASWKNIALENNPEMKAKQAEIAIAKQEVKKNRAGHLPNLDVVANISQSTSDSVATFNQDIFNKSMGIQLNIPIYTGGSVSAQTVLSESMLKKAKADFESTKNAIVLDLRRQFNTLKTGALKIESLNQSVESANFLITATEKSIMAGFRTNQDLLEARKQLFQTKRDLSIERYNYLVAYINFKKAAGILNDTDMTQLAEHFSTQP